MVTHPSDVPTAISGDLQITGGQVLGPAGRLQRADVAVRAGRITDVVPAPAPRQQPVPATPDPGTLDATGLTVVPGFVDLQCNGAGGIDLTAEPERLWEVAALLPRWGVTAWLPTIVTAPDAVRQRALAALATPPAEVTGGRWAGAHPLGLHLEGPFLAPERRGAHAPAHLQLPSLAAVDGWSRDRGVAVVTLAPELPGALDVVRALTERGVVVSAGHSSATVDQARAGVDAGVRWVTHLFNAMAPLHHRDPGLAGVALTDDRLAVGLIADGLHLHPAAVDLAVRALGERLTLVTDAVAALGAAPGKVRLGDVEALADGEGVRLADGTLAGSVLSLDRAVANLMRFAGAGLAEAVDAASAAPARLLGQAPTRGVILPGALGDLVLLDGVEVVATVVGGRVAYRRGGEGGS